MQLHTIFVPLTYKKTYKLKKHTNDKNIGSGNEDVNKQKREYGDAKQKKEK